MEIGHSAYDFELPGVDGKTYSLKDFADKPVLVLSSGAITAPMSRRMKTA